MMIARLFLVPLLALAACATPPPPVLSSEPLIRRTTIKVGDLERSLGFYRDVVGLRELRRMDLSSDKTRRSLAVPDETAIAFVTLGDAKGAMIGLLAVAADSASLGRAEGKLLADGDVILVFEVPDIAATRARLIAAGFPIQSEIEPLGTRGGWEMIVRDPDGVRVQILQFGGSPPAAAE